MPSNSKVTESVARHTPGPWASEAISAEAYSDPDLSIPDDSRFWIVGDQATGEVLASVDRTSDGAEEANARLIAAAPELLDALKKTVDVLRAWNGMGLSPGDAIAAWRAYQHSPEMRRINAAIAKAEGRP